jgi:hypothetical protein
MDDLLIAVTTMEADGIEVDVDDSKSTIDGANCATQKNSMIFD